MGRAASQRVQAFEKGFLANPSASSKSVGHVGRLISGLNDYSAVPKSNVGDAVVGSRQESLRPLAWIVVMLWLTIMPILILTIVVFAVCGFALKRISNR